MVISKEMLIVASSLYVCVHLEALGGCKRVWWAPGAAQPPSRAGTWRIAGLKPNPLSTQHYLQITFTKGDFIFIDLPTNQLFQK